MKVGDLVKESKIPIDYDVNNPWSKHFCEIISYGVIISASEHNNGRYANETLWFEIFWGNGTFAWASTEQLELA